MAALVRVANSAVLGATEVCGAMYVTKRHKSSGVTINNYKRGTGGRSSFSGTVATVFGAKSTLGLLVVNRLGKVGSQVILPYRGDPYYMRDLKVMGDLGQILFNPFDLKNEESVRNSMQYSNVVINLIGAEYETRNFSFHDVHVEGARRIARLARECGVEKFVHVSHLNAGKVTKNFTKTGSQFLKSKLEGEAAVREEFPEAIIMRPAEFIDLNDKFIAYYTKNPRSRREFFPMSSHPVRRVLTLWRLGEETIRMPIRTKDVAVGIMAALSDPTAPGKTYQCVGPCAYKLADLIEYIYLCRDKEIMLRDDSWRIRLKAMLRETIYKTLSFPLPRITLDMLEKETVNDELDPMLPTLKDLGVMPENIEEIIEFMSKPYVGAGIFTEKKGILLKPERPTQLFPTLD